eukprot:3249613-Heterocapsa_arctica.AAC.1
MSGSSAGKEQRVLGRTRGCAAGFLGLNRVEDVGFLCCERTPGACQNSGLDSWTFMVKLGGGFRVPPPGKNTGCSEDLG